MDIRFVLISILYSLQLIRTSQFDGRRNVTVTTTYGDIIGLRKNIFGKDIFAFLGVPYAKPPIGRLRFREPEPMDKWDGILSATKLPKTCFQNLPEQYELNNPALRAWVNNTEMSEDCLYLNIWTPNLPDKNQVPKGFNHNGNSADKSANIIPTMVWIHGDGFTSGSSTLDIYNGEILASKMNVIVVTINYRLGPFGFLSFNMEDIPGNQGLMDQVMALEWIKNNTERFGGNNKHITLFGSNAGAVSASLHLVSPKTQGLFNQVIMQSASAVSWWAYESPNMAIEKARKLADISGCHVSRDLTPNASAALFDCLRSLDPVTLVVNQWRTLISFNVERKTRQNLLNQQYGGKHQTQISTSASFYFDIPFKPVNESKYLPFSPLTHLTKYRSSIQKKRVMLGVNKNEGLSHLIRGLRMFFMPSDDSIVQPLDFKYGTTDVDPVDMLAFYMIDERYLQRFLIQAIAFEYQVPSRFVQQFDWQSQDVIEVFDNVAGDYSFKCPVIDFADLYADISKVYLYSFEHQTKHIPMPKWTGVLQGHEIAYIFGKPFDTEFGKNFYNFTDEERELSHKMMKFWTNFAQTGFPNYRLREFHTRLKEMHWENYDKRSIVDDRAHIVFQNKTVYLSKNLRRHECLFWREYIPQMLNNNCHPRTKIVQVSINETKPTQNSMNKGEETPISKSSQLAPINKPSRKRSSLVKCDFLFIIIFLYLLRLLDNFN